MNLSEVAQRIFEPFTSSTAGNSVAVLWNHQVIYSHVAGWADVQKQVPITPETPFCIGSITKTMVALCIMQLVEAGKIKLDDPVEKHLRSIQIHSPFVNNPIRIRHLLTHTSGLGYFRSLTDLLLPAGALGSLKNAPPLPEYYRKGLTPIYPPEHRWSYCNHAFALLGQLVEDVTGKPFSDVLIQRVLHPAGMQNPAYGRPENRALPHLQKKRGFVDAPDLDIIVKPAGAVFANLNDMVAYAQSLLALSPALLKPESFREVFQRHHQVHPDLMGMGLGFLIEKHGGHEVYCHSGGWIGYNSNLHVCPEKGLAVVVMANSASSEVQTLPLKFLQEALGQPEPQETRLPLCSLKFAHSYAEQVRGIEKPLVFLSQPGGLKLRFQNGKLLIYTLTGPWRKGVPLKPLGQNVFEIEDPEQPLKCALEVQGNRVTALDLGLNRLQGHF